LHLVGILFPHINDDARSKSHQTRMRTKIWSFGRWILGAKVTVKTEVTESKKGSREEGKEGGEEEEEEEEEKEEKEDGDGGSSARIRNLHQYFVAVSDTFLDTCCHFMLLQSSRQVPT